MSVRISPTLNMQDNAGQKSVCCSGCGTALADAQAHWKDHVPVKRTKVAGLTGWSGSVHPDLELREFSCPSCGQLLDSETALSTDPYLYDVVHV